MSRKTIRLLCGAVFLASLCAFIWFALLLSQTRAEYSQGEADLKGMREIRGETAPVLSEEIRKEMDEASLRAALVEERAVTEEGYKRLWNENPDMIGWIRIEDTMVDYPVMQTPEEPDFYLRRGFDKKYSSYGMIYMDASCIVDNGCGNYILYGHHMKNGSMFASIEKYKSEKYWKEHPVIQLDLMDENGIRDQGRYEVLAAFRLSAAEMNSDFAYKLAAGSEEDYEGLIDYIRSHRLYGTGVTAQWPDQLVTLTTCEYTQRDGRFFVVGRRCAE